MGLKAVHRTLAAILIVFIGTHLAVHLAALGGPDAHIAAQKTVDWVYRSRLVEPVLVLALAAQVVVGYRLLRRRLGEPGKSVWAWVQIVSGGYLVFFLIAHTTAALATRYSVGLETNFYWASGPAILMPLALGFRPYYVLAILAVFSHLAAAMMFRWGSKGLGISLAAWGVVAFGGLVSGAIVAALSGALYPIDLPAAYMSYFRGIIESLFGANFAP